jgi:hypothetical protein
MAKRYQRELEVEAEMAQVITVHGKIALFENRIQRQASLNSSVNSSSGGGGRVSTNGVIAARISSKVGGGSGVAKTIIHKAHQIQVQKQLSAASLSMEILSGRLSVLANNNANGAKRV